jgi:hypothetical protein
MLRHGDAFYFDRHDGSVWHNAKRLTEGDRLQAVRIKPRRGWLGWPDVWLVFEHRRPMRILSAPYLAMALTLPGFGGQEAVKYHGLKAVASNRFWVYEVFCGYVSNLGA